jgi:predicted HicB family RNase H-like nuclease
MGEKKKAVKAVKVAKAAAGKKGNGIAPAPKHGPNLTLRMRNQAQIDRIKQAAARVPGMSMNTWAVEVLDRASAQ